MCVPCTVPNKSTVVKRHLSAETKSFLIVTTYRLKTMKMWRAYKMVKVKHIPLVKCVVTMLLSELKLCVLLCPVRSVKKMC